MTHQLMEPMQPRSPTPTPPAAAWARLWFHVAVGAGVTGVWLALALAAAARGDFVMMAIDVAGVVAGIASLAWGAHLLLQLADADNVARFACRMAEQRFEALLADFAASAERDEHGYLQ